MKNNPFKRILSTTLAALMLTSMSAVTQTAGFMSVTASAVAGVVNVPEIVESGELDNCTYTLDSEGVLVITGETLILPSGIFNNKGLTGIRINANSVKIHPQAFLGNDDIAYVTFTDMGQTLIIEGTIEGLTENTLVTIPLYAKKLTPAGKKFNYTEYSSENSAKRDDLQARYDAAAYLWEDTSAILAEAEADEFITVSDTDPSSEEFTNRNWSTTFPNAKVQHFGTMAGFGTMADPYRIENTDNWRYLAYMTEKGILSGSYYGQDTGEPPEPISRC